jgi:hypothetical protein
VYQLNVQLPQALQGRRDVAVVFPIDAIDGNTVAIQVQQPSVWPFDHSRLSLTQE